jgi:Matrixin
MKQLIWMVLLGALIGIIMGAVMGCYTEAPYRYTAVSTEGHRLIRKIPVYVDKNFGEEDKIAIDDALEDWNYVLSGYIVFEVKSYGFDLDVEEIKEAYRENGLMIMKVDSSVGFIPVAGGGDKTVAWADAVGVGHKIYMVRDRIGKSGELKELVMHELGHILGAGHIDGEDSLMRSVYVHQDSRCVDEWTVRKVAEYQGLEYRNLNHCFYD